MPRMTEKEKEEYKRLVADKKELKRKIKEAQSDLDKKKKEHSEIKDDLVILKRMHNYYEL